jgi:hypothetical protein
MSDFSHSLSPEPTAVGAYGQFLMLLGLTNLFVIVCLFIQFRKLIRGVRDENAV